MGAIGEQIAAYDGWRGELAAAVRRYGAWLDDVGLADDIAQERLAAILARLADERMTVAFVAEFSRGKSELINAIFFPRQGQRIVPSSAGRTTMCPTELLYDAREPPSVRLLPIRTRTESATLAELRGQRDAWREIVLPPDDTERLRLAFRAVQETERVSVDEARALGFVDESTDDARDGAGHDGDATGRSPGFEVGSDGEEFVEIPRWRHAIVNYPHPLLEMGLVIIDTPGLNAIGAEPELTLSMIPKADAVLFVLAADTGVTRTDMEVWRRYVSPVHRSGRLVVLNKIDGLWDELKDEAGIAAEIDRQVASVAGTLGVPPARVFPVSAQKGLVARAQASQALLARSRLPELEQALSAQLVPHQQRIMVEHVERDFEQLNGGARSILQTRRRNLTEQILELDGLRGKNRDVMDHMVARIRIERDDFEKGLRHFQGLRSVFGRHSQALLTTVSVEALRGHVREARESLRASNFSSSLRAGMSRLIDAARADFVQATRLTAEVGTLMSAMYRSFATRHGLALGVPLLFSMKRYLAELERIDDVQRRHFGPLSMLTVEKWALVRRFFESVASRIRALYEKLARDLQAWLRAVMAPIEGQIREHRAQLGRRYDVVRRVIEATGSLESRIEELDRARAELEQKIAIADELAGQIRTSLGRPEVPVDQPATV